MQYLPSFSNVPPRAFGRTLVGLVLCIAVFGAGDFASAQPLSVGLKGGVSQGTFHGDDVDDPEFRAGFSGGAYLRYRVNPAFSVQPEVLFTMKGADTGASEPVLGSGDYELHYLEIPVLFKLEAPLDGLVKPSVYAGPQLGFNLYGERDDVEIDDDRLQTAEFSGVVGGDLSFDLSRFDVGPLHRIVLDGRYALGLSNAFDVSGDPSIRTGTFVGSVGVKFAL